jgi:hypothetical protein
MADLQKENATSEGSAFDVSGGQAKTAVQNDQQANHTPIPEPVANADQAEADAKAKLSRSTSTQAQIAKLCAFLREGPKTTHYLRMMGISHPAGRVNDLRNAGWEILTQRVGTIDSDGFEHFGVAEYVLLKEAPRQTSPDTQGV